MMGTEGNVYCRKEAEHDYDVSIDVRGKSQMNLKGKFQWCPTQRNCNGVSNGSVQILCKGANNREAALPVCHTQDRGSIDGILTRLLDMLFQRRTAEAAAAVASARSHNGEGRNMAVITNRK